MGLFSKKPGGTFFGNVFRTVVNKASNGMLGTGAQKIELGQTQTNAQLAAAGTTVTSPLTPPGSAPDTQTLLSGIKNVLNNGMTQNVAVQPQTMLYLGIAAVAIFLFMSKKKR